MGKFIFILFVRLISRCVDGAENARGGAVPTTKYVDGAGNARGGAVATTKYVDGAKHAYGSLVHTATTEYVDGCEHGSDDVPPMTTNNCVHDTENEINDALKITQTTIARYIYCAKLFCGGAAHKYSNFAVARPVTSNLVQGCVLFIGGDIVAQIIQPELDPSKTLFTHRIRRALSSGAFGATYIGLVAAQWYRLMDHAMPGHGTRPLIAKVASNAVALGIVGNTANIFCRRLSRSGNIVDAAKFTKMCISRIIAHDFKIWPAFDVICFRCIPQHLRPSAAGFMSFLWNTYLSLTANMD